MGQDPRGKGGHHTMSMADLPCMQFGSWTTRAFRKLAMWAPRLPKRRNSAMPGGHGYGKDRGSQMVPQDQQDQPGSFC